MSRFILIAFLSLLGAPASGQVAFDEAERDWQRDKNRPALLKRFLAFQKLANTRDGRALPILAGRYARPQPPEEQERFLLAWLAGDAFSAPTHRQVLWEWTSSQDRDADAWLRYQALRSATAERLMELAIDPKASPFLRAAAIEAAAINRDQAALKIVPRVLAALPKNTRARSLLAESCAAVLRGHRDARAEPAFRTAAEPLIALLEEKQPTSPRARLTIARQLARVFDSKRISTAAGYWLRLLGHEQDKDDGGTRAMPSFFGVEASGTRIAYLMDLSDSMLEPLTKEDLQDMRRPITGRASKPDADLPWDKIRTRFDLARAVLERSLRFLDKSVSFTIVGFGKEAGFFRATKGLVRANKGQVSKAIRELNDIRPGPKTRARPHGTLRGETNLHGALILAFRARFKGVEDEHEHVAAKLFESGCDTIYVLSDGAPTDDDFGHVDAFEGGKVATDAEAGKTELSDRKHAFFRGPYRIPRYLLRDVERMNLFRKAEIHCIAIGDADEGLLTGIAGIGFGNLRVIGKKR